MFERFTDNARRAVVLAQEESRLLHHDYIGTEHILLGLLHGGQEPRRKTTAGRALASLHISLEAARRQVRETIGEGEAPPTGHVPFTPGAKEVLALSLSEALKELGQRHIGTEHLLLGLIREGNGVAVAVLQELGADVDQIRRALALAVAERTAPPETSTPEVRLRPMRKDEWDAWRAQAVNEYADDMMRNEAITREQAMTHPAETTDALLTEGVHTPGHRFFVAEDPGSGRRVGHLWLGPRARNPDPAVAWLYDIYVDEENRGRGIGQALMRLLEVEARAAGTRRIELNVFGDNERARRLYASLGYVVMASQLGKDLGS